ncbi:MAG: hypothetical protein HY922_08275 [Elusimicrobia bacterium]|nr:hypothetical protein [Elusimicrobiota bacterium]
MDDLIRGRGDGWLSIVDNRWLGVPRVFFLSWLTQAVFARIWGVSAAAPYFLFIFSAHLLSCLLLFRILRTVGLDERAAAFAALFSLVTPTSANDLFWMNNWFFVLPVTAFLILTHAYLRPFKNRWVDLACLTAAALAVQFFGEQMLAVLYAGFALALWRAMRLRGRPEARQAVMRALAPFAVSSAMLAAYYFRCVAPFSPPAVAWDWSAVLMGAWKFGLLHAQSFFPGSRLFGAWSLAPSASTLVLSAAVAAVLIHCRLGSAEPRNKERAPDVPGWPFLAVPLAVIALTAMLILYGLARRIRSDVEYRYIYPSGIALCVFFAAALHYAANSLLGGRLKRLLPAAFAGTAVYLSALMIYDVRDIWGSQKRLEERIWTLIDAQYRPEFRFVATDSFQEAVLMPDRSNVTSDFQDDFGVKCRLRNVYGSAPIITRRYQPERDYGEAIDLVAYRGGVLRAKKSEVFAVVFRYGKSFADLLKGKVSVFSNFESYKKFRESEPFTFSP